MKLLLVSEGKHELGVAGERGALQILVERLLECDCQIITRKVSDPTVITEKGKGEGMFKRFVAWVKHAARSGFDAIVLLIDEDGDLNRQRQIEDAQSSTLVPFPRALGLAIRSFDAWILADQVAMSTVLGRNVDRQPDMESLRDPKSVCDSICDRQFALSEFYALVANAANLAELESRCAEGFAPFAARVRNLPRPA